jgi:hypothetical protein
MDWDGIAFGVVIKNSAVLSICSLILMIGSLPTFCKLQRHKQALLRGKEELI